MDHGASVSQTIIRQGRALVQAIEAMGVIEPSGWIERMLVRLLMTCYKRRLRGIVAAAPSWMTEEIVGVSGWREQGVSMSPSDN